MDGPKNTAIHLSEDHDYIILYARNASVWRPRKLARSEAMLSRYRNPDNDPRGAWLLSDLAARNFYSEGRYSITTPTGRVIDGPPAGSYWRVSRTRFAELEADGRIWWGKTGNNRPGIKRFLSEVQEGVVPQTLWLWKDVGSTRHAKQELSRLMEAGASQDLFITPKPVRLLRRILDIASDPDSLILDAFAGSGTTGQAVLEANRADGGNRRFILVEMDETICQSVTAERLKRVIAQGAEAPGLPAVGAGEGFQYVTLGEPLFDARGRVAADVTFATLAAHVWFTETDTPLTEGAGDSPLLGVYEGKAVYLLFNGVLRDRRPQGGNVLTSAVLAGLPPHAGPRVVYGESCRLGAARLTREGVVFRQVPYGVRTD